MSVEQRLLVAYFLFIAFVSGFATCRFIDSKRVETIVSEYNQRVEALNDRLMELEK